MNGKIRVLITWAILLAVLGGVYTSLVWQDYSQVKDLPVHVIFPKLENDADCIIITQGDHTIMIDTGEKSDAPEILQTLAAYNITKLNYLILTHPDADHIGGAVDILKEIPVNRVLLPYIKEESETLNTLMNYFNEVGITPVNPTHTLKLSIGTMRILIYPPLEKIYKDTNNNSLAVLVNHEEVTMLFTGDALRKRTEELLLTNWPPIDLLKIPYHGRANSASEIFLTTINPTYAVVTAKQADEIIVDTAKSQDINLLYTGNEALTFESTGTKLSIVENKGAVNDGN